MCAIGGSIAFPQRKSGPESHVTPAILTQGRDTALLEQSGACVREGFRGFPHDTQQGHVSWHRGYRPGEHASARTRVHTRSTKNKYFASKYFVYCVDAVAHKGTVTTFLADTETRTLKGTRPHDSNHLTSVISIDFCHVGVQTLLLH